MSDDQRVSHTFVPGSLGAIMHDPEQLILAPQNAGSEGWSVH